jgi:flagellar motor switch protein FliN/FliY
MSDVLELLSREERGAIAEMTTVAMGAAASTLGMLIGHEVDIIPENISTYASGGDLPALLGEDAGTLVELRYVKGLGSTSYIVLRSADARHLSSLMLGEEPTATNPAEPLDDMAEGAVSELMNQMMNAASTGLASLLHETVEIANPTVSNLDPVGLSALFTEPVAVNRLQLTISGQTPIDLFELKSVADFQALVLAVENATMRAMEAAAQVRAEEEAAEPAYASPPARAGGASETPMAGDPVTVRPVQFSSFDQQGQTYGEENRNLELVMDVTLNLSVELGKTNLSIKEVLELTRGSVVELERVAGEPVDLMANGKLIARGEVVVIEDNFGLRITSIVSPAERLRGL